jgi:hypothetical protein
MLAQPNDFGYSPSHAQNMANFDQQPQHHHHQSGERPKLFGLDHHPGFHHGGGMNDFQQMVNGTPHAGMAPHQHTPMNSEFDHEPLMLNLHNGQHPFYPNFGQSMLHVSTDYSSSSSVGGMTPSSSSGSGSKRSREELNMKEKKRMFKLNDRINALKSILDDAGVQSKKNKQSILDNTYHYISMLRSNLLIAKQKAERAEKQAENYKKQINQQQNSNNNNNKSTTHLYQKNTGEEELFFLKKSFEQSSIPRLIVKSKINQEALFFEVVFLNQAFLQHAGVSEENLKQNQDLLQQSLCIDTKKLQKLMENVTNPSSSSSSKPNSMIVQAKTSAGITNVTLMVSAYDVEEEDGKVHQMEFSLIPLDISSQVPPNAFDVNDVNGEMEKEEDELLKENVGQQESSPSGVMELIL